MLDFIGELSTQKGRIVDRGPNVNQGGGEQRQSNGDMQGMPQGYHPSCLRQGTPLPVQRTATFKQLSKINCLSSGLGIHPAAHIP
jgi:hypothetical protein